MRPVRSTLLWMARNAWLRDHVPRLRFARRAVRRFMPGESLEDAFTAAERLRAAGLGVLFTHLGENLSTLDQAGQVADHYRLVIEQDAAVRAARGDAWPAVEVSVKPTQLGLDQDEEVCLRHCDELAALAAAAGTWLWLDMEGSAYTEATIRLYERLRSRHERVGICLQAYLRRSLADVARLLPARPAVRLVKGAYDEPAAIALRDRRDVAAAFESLAVILARAAARGEARLALGTHDSALVERIGATLEAEGAPRRAIEVHMLYGIREDELARLRDAGYPAFSLVAYGSAWYAWYMRRLAERPANVAFALRQLLPSR